MHGPTTAIENTSTRRARVAERSDVIEVLAPSVRTNHHTMARTGFVPGTRLQPNRTVLSRSPDSDEREVLPPLLGNPARAMNLDSTAAPNAFRLGGLTDFPQRSIDRTGELDGGVAARWTAELDTKQ